MIDKPLRKVNPVIAVTRSVQPLDVSINKPFKDKLREKWRAWMATGEHKYTKTGNLKKPAYDLMCWWIMEAWNEIPAQMIIKSFEKCGIINNSDNSLTRVEGEVEETYEEHIVVTLEDISGNKEND